MLQRETDKPEQAGMDPKGTVYSPPLIWELPGDKGIWCRELLSHPAPNFRFHTQAERNLFSEQPRPS